MLLGSRHRRDPVSSRRDDYKLWNHESDSDRQRQPPGPSQRYDADYPAGTGHDKHRRSSKRADVSGSYLQSSAVPAQRHTSSRHVSGTGETQAYTSVPQTQAQAAPAPPVASSSRARAHDNSRTTLNLDASAQKRTDRRSPRSSEERLYAVEHATTSRASVQISRTAYPTTAAPQVPSSSQAFWIPPSQPTRDPASSSRHHREKTREREYETREQRRERKERERAMEEERRMAATGKHGDWSRDRTPAPEPPTDVDRAKEYASDKEKELERQRRREEKERRREEREEERERARRKEEKEQRRERERRREENEQERAPRYREKERMPRDKDGHARDDGLRYYAVYPDFVPKQSSRHRTDERGRTRHGPFLTDQIPSSSSNVALPAALQTHQGAYMRSDEARRDDVPPQVPEKEKKHRSHRERVLTQQAGQESGVSSSEQELSGKERKTHRTAERRRMARDLDGDAHPSGPSGSEAERDRERRKASRAVADGFASYSNKVMDERRQSMSHSQVPNPVPPGAQCNALVGSLHSQHLAPQVVSIRAGQGPADPQIPLSYNKGPVPTGQTRSRDQQPISTQVQSTITPATAGPVYGSQPYSTVQTSSRQDGYASQSQVYAAQRSSSRLAAPTSSLDVPRAQGTQQYQQHTTFPPQAHQQSSAQYPNTSVQDTTGNGPTTYQTSIYPGQGPPTQRSNPNQAVPSGVGDPYTTYQSGTHQNTAAPAAEASHVSRTHILSIPAQPFQSIAIPKSGSSSSPRKSSNPHLQATAANVTQSAHVARLSVYRSPGPAVSADLVLPVSVNPSRHSSNGDPAKTPRRPAQDLALRFPVHEDMLSSASSSTLAPGTGRSTAGILPGHTQHHAGTMHQISSTGPVPTRSSPHTPLLDGASVPYDAPTKHSAQTLRAGSDVPIPIPPPVAHPPPTQDLHTSQQQSQLSRPQGIPLQPNPPGISTASAYAAGAYTSSKHAQHNATQAPNAILAAVLTASNQSPRQPHKSSSQQTLQRPPSLHYTSQLGSATPKNASSVRLAPRNGSSDTVQHIPTKNSPNDLSRPLVQRHSNASLRAQQFSSRPDTKSLRAPQTHEYPDPARYRSPAPQSTYPVASQQHNNYPMNTTNNASNYAYAPPPATHHSRSASQPTNQPIPYDYQGGTQRNHASAAAPTPATASSASAIAAAYRNGLYSADHSSRQQEASSQRVLPPRSAPSPAPSITGRPYAPAPSLLSKSGFATTATPSQPQRGQTHPTVNSRPPGAPISTSHSRSVSDPQLARVAVSGHPSTPALSKAQLGYHQSPSEQELLKTPSSIARSVSKGSQLPRPSSRGAQSQSGKATKEKDPRKKGIFGFLRSRSSPPKEEAVAVSTTVSIKTRQRSISQTTLTAVAASVKNIVTPHPTPHRVQPSAPSSRSPAPPPNPASGTASRPSLERRRPPEQPEVIAPIPVPHPGVRASATVRITAADPSAQAGHASQKSFTPFRLLSRRHRAVSDASVEAQDGTATNTVIGDSSVRSSTAGRPSPPLRDPVEATRTWSKKEAQEHIDKGTLRRHRPGVTFDVQDEWAEMETYQPVRHGKPGRR